MPTNTTANPSKAHGTNPPSNPFTTWLGRWWPALLWAAVIWTLSTSIFGAAHTLEVILPALHWLFPAWPPDKLLLWHHVIRKCAHVTEYFIFGLLITRGIRLGHPTGRWRWTLVAIAMLAAYATLDEYHQSFVPGRTPAVRDVLLDVVGGASAQILAALLAFWREERRRLAAKNSHR